MATTASRVTVGTTPVRLDSATEADFSPGSPAFASTYGQGVTVINRGDGSVFIGTANVTAATGFELVAGSGFSERLHIGDGLYAISASGTNRVDVIQVGV